MAAAREVLNKDSNEVVHEVLSKESEAAVDRNSMTTEEAVVEEAVEDSAGRTTTSLSEIAMLPSLYGLTGKCWKRLTMLGFRN